MKNEKIKRKSHREQQLRGAGLGLGEQQRVLLSAAYDAYALRR